MPVRKITKSHRSVVGKVMEADEVHRSESTLERDFLITLRFDLQVARFETQPCRIPYVDAKGTERTYTPDVLVRYRRDILPACRFSPLLCEVKYQEDLEENAALYKPKFEAAEVYANERGWAWRVLNEHAIRTPYFENARVLTPYKRVPYDYDQAALLKDSLQELRQATPNTLLAYIFQDKWMRATLMPMLWKLIGTYEIRADLDRPLTMTSELWLED